MTCESLFSINLVFTTHIISSINIRTRRPTIILDLLVFQTISELSVCLCFRVLTRETLGEHLILDDTIMSAYYYFYFKKHTIII